MEDLWQVHDSGRYDVTVGCALSRLRFRLRSALAGAATCVSVLSDCADAWWRRGNVGVPAHLPVSDAGAGRLPFARGFPLSQARTERAMVRSCRVADANFSSDVNVSSRP